jgi:hypothetical protein
LIDLRRKNWANNASPALKAVTSEIAVEADGPFAEMTLADLINMYAKATPEALFSTWQLGHLTKVMNGLKQQLDQHEAIPQRWLPMYNWVFRRLSPDGQAAIQGVHRVLGLPDGSSESQAWPADVVATWNQQGQPDSGSAMSSFMAPTLPANDSRSSMASGHYEYGMHGPGVSTFFI